MNKDYYKIYNFIDWSRIIFICSVVLCSILFIVMTIRGFNWGLDFTGGVLIEIISEKQLDINKIQASFAQSGFKNVTVQHFSNLKNIIIHLSLIQDYNHFNQQIKMKILNILNDIIISKFVVQQINWIGPDSSKNFIQIGIIALLASLICIFLYITFRFELRLAIGVVISIIHDMMIIMGVLSIFFIEINSTIVAAFISAIGYSLNDKVVIFDRIRENFNCISGLYATEILNISLSQVLNRTIITSVTTVMVLLILLIFGGTMLHGFSVILLIGVTVCTISSTYIDSFLALKFGIERKHFIKKKLNDIDF